MIRSLRHTFVALLIVGATTAALGAAPAVAAKSPPCWKVLINDWYDGRIDGIYAIHCYREALDHLPADVDTYSSARDDIKQALQKRITQNHNGQTTTTTGGGSAGGGGGGSTGGGGGSGGGNDASGGPIPSAIDNLGPKKADSLPVPLIVLGGVALVLMAAGAAGFLTRRNRLRRAQLASAASAPHGAENRPPEQR